MFNQISLATVAAAIFTPSGEDIASLQIPENSHCLDAMTVVMFDDPKEGVRVDNAAVIDLKRKARSISRTTNQPQRRVVECYFDTTAAGYLNAVIISITDRKFKEPRKLFQVDSGCDQYVLWALCIAKSSKQSEKERNKENVSSSNDNNNDSYDSNNNSNNNNDNNNDNSSHRNRYNDNNRSNNRKNDGSDRSNNSDRNNENRSASSDEEDEEFEEIDEELQEIIDGIIKNNNFEEKVTVTDTEIMTEMMRKIIIPQMILKRKMAADREAMSSNQINSNSENCGMDKDITFWLCHSGV
jgi:hypothetical protein